MAYPEPTPMLRGGKAKQFIKRLETFKLTKKQKEFYKDAVAYYNRIEAKNQALFECQKCGRKGLDKFGIHATSKLANDACDGKVVRIKWSDAW